MANDLTETRKQAMATNMYVMPNIKQLLFLIEANLHILLSKIETSISWSSSVSRKAVVTREIKKNAKMLAFCFTCNRV